MAFRQGILLGVWTGMGRALYMIYKIWKSLAAGHNFLLHFFKKISELNLGDLVHLLPSIVVATVKFLFLPPPLSLTFLEVLHLLEFLGSLSIAGFIEEICQIFILHGVVFGQFSTSGA